MSGIFVVAVLFAVGVIASDADFPHPIAWCTATITLALGIYSICHIIKYRRLGYRNLLALPTTLFLAFAAGWIADRVVWLDIAQQTQQIKQCPQRNFAARVTGDARHYNNIVSIPVQTQQGWNVRLSIPQQLCSGGVPQMGQTIVFSARLRTLPTDSIKRFRNIVARATAYKMTIVRHTHATLFQRWRAMALRRISNTALSNDAKAMCSALLVACRSALRTEVYDDFRKSGCAHLLALSGMHLGIITLLLALVLGHEVRNRWRNTIVMLAVVWSFTMVAGAPWSLLRAALFVSLIICGQLLHRHTYLPDRIFAALLIIMIVSPHAIFNVGLQLSFAAMLGIALLTYLKSNMPTTFTMHNRVARYVCGLVATSLICTLFTIPIAAWHFNQVALYGVASGIVLIPMTMAAIPLTITTLIAPTPLMCELTNIWIDTMQHIAHTFATLPGA